MPQTQLTDFPDRLSPMLVKELRQGLRARSFTMLFLIFQCVLAFILLVAGSSISSEGAGIFASVVIFTLFSIAALIIQPMRGVTALSSEITGNTIEMMALTRLTAWRIVFGKWIAIVSQTALILTTIIPYLILRYFFGGMVLIGELVFVSLIFLTSMALTGVMVGFSATSAKLARALPIMGMVVMAQVMPRMLFRSGLSSLSMDFFTLSSTESQVTILAYLCFIGYFGWCALSHGTSSIAPVSENHSTARRVIALGLTGIGVAIAFHPSVDPHVLTLIFGMIAAPAIITAITEPSIPLPPLWQPFQRRGVPGRIAGTFLLPGWPAGSIFTVLMIVLSIAGIVIANRHHPTARFEPPAFIICLSLLGGVLLPGLLSAMFTRQESKRFTNFLLFLLFSIILTVAPMILTSINNQEKFLWLFAWNPPVGMAMLNTSHFKSDTVIAVIAAVDCAILVLLIATSTLAMTRYRKAIEAAGPDTGATFPTTMES